MEVVIRLVHIHDDFYVAVPDSQYKLLKALRDTTYKDNVVVQYEIDRMLSNKGKINMPLDQWKSFLGNVFFTDGTKESVSHKELRNRVTLGSFIHHQAKTGAISKAREPVNRTKDNSNVNKVQMSDDEVNRKNNALSSLENKILDKTNRSLDRIAVGADAGAYVKNIIIYLGSWAVSTSLYLNTQTGSIDENFASVMNAMDGMVSLANCVKTMTIPSGLASETLLSVRKLIFDTPYSYAVDGTIDHIRHWNEISAGEKNITSAMSGNALGKEYADIAGDLAKFKGMPFSELVHWLKLDNLPSVYHTDPETYIDDYVTDMNFSAERIFSRFGTATQDFIEGIGKSGTGHSSGETLSNGREMHNLFSYAKVWNDFSLEHFTGKCANTFVNLLHGGKSDSYVGDDPANIQIRRQTIITFGIMALFMFSGLMYTFDTIKNYTKSEKVKKDELERNIAQDGNYEKRVKKKLPEKILDVFEMVQVAFLVMTATVEFIGITNVVSSGDGMDKFLSESYSTNWYYMSAMGTIASQSYLRSALGTTTRHPDSYDLNSVNNIAMELVVSAVLLDPTEMLHKMLGSTGSNGSPQYSRYLLIAQIAVRSGQIAKYVYKKYKGTETHVLTQVAIDLHANMLLNGRRDHAKILRERLFHNKQFNRVIMTQLCAI